MSDEQVTFNWNRFVKQTQSDIILSCSVGASLNESEHVVYEWSEGGPVYGPNGELELDPELNPYQTCNGNTFAGVRPVFATCKNNCPGGELTSVDEI